MKKQHKIVSLLLVFSLLLGSLVFTVSADSTGGDGDTSQPAYTSVATSNPADVLAAMRYDADDNLLGTPTLSTAASNGWGSSDARQSYIITNNETGDVYYKETSDGSLAAANEYINLNFKRSVSLLYDAGYNEYVIFEYDLAHEATSGTYIKEGAPVSSAALVQTAIVRGSTKGTSFGNNKAQYLRDMAVNPGFTHVTTVYDFTSGNAYVFIDGYLANIDLTYDALTSAVHTQYLAGESGMTIAETRIGSNSCDTMHLDNVYVRYERNAVASDTLDAALASGKLSDWNNNIFDESYASPEPYWDTTTVVANDYGYIGSITDGYNTAVDMLTPGNLITGASRANASSEALLNAGLPANGAYLDSYKVHPSGSSNAYFLFVANQTYQPGFAASNKLNDKDGNGSGDNDNNPFISAPITYTDFSVASGTKAMYVFEVDIASHSELLKDVNVQLEIRNNSTGGGFPFSQEVEFADYVSPTNKWVRFTLVGDIATNKLYVFVDGKLMGTAGYAYNAAQLVSGETTLEARSARIQLSTNSVLPTVELGQSLAIDNIYENIYVDGNTSLSAAISSGSLSDWDGYRAFKSGTYLPEVARVNGVTYYNEAALAQDLRTNDYLEIEFLATPFTPVVLAADATVNTNGLDFAELITLGEGAEVTGAEGNKVFVSSPYIPSFSSTLIGDGTTAVSSFPYLKDTAATHNTVGGISEVNKGCFNYYVMDNGDGSDLYYMLTPTATTSPANTFINVSYTGTSITETTYTIIDIDVATQTEFIDMLALNVINRSDKGGNYPADGTSVNISDYLRPSDTWAHITLVVDYGDNVQHVFVNGVYAGLAGKANNRSSNSGESIADHIAAGNFATSSLRINMPGSTAMDLTDTALIDNVCAKVYASNAAAGDIEACISAGTLDGYTYEVKGRAGEALPKLATVNGTTYGNVHTLSQALVTNEELDVEFHYSPALPATVRANATVDTNGLANTVSVDPSCTSTINGEIIKVVSPFVQNKDSLGMTTDPKTMVNALKADVAGNIFNTMQLVSNTGGGWGSVGARQTEIISNPITGETFLRESPNGTVADSGNEYVNYMFPTIALKYDANYTEYFVADFDLAYEGAFDKLMFQFIPRNSGSGRWGTDVRIDTLGLTEGEMAHVTAVCDFTSAKAHLFVDGEYLKTVDNGAVNSTGHTEYKGGTALNFAELKIGSNSNQTIYLANMCLRYYKTPVGTGELASVINNQDISLWGQDVYTNGNISELPAIANMDGVDYSGVASLSAAMHSTLLAGKVANIELLHDSDVEIPVSCDAIINTNGLNNNIVAADGRAITYDGNRIYVTAPNLDAYHETSGNNILSIVKSGVTGNLFASVNLANYNATGLRGSYIATNLETGEKFGYDGLYDKTAEFTGSNSYIEFRPTASKIPYELGVNQYIVYDLDIAIEDYDVYFPIASITRQNNAGGTGVEGVWGTNSFNLNTYFRGRVAEGEFAHVTIIASPDTRQMHVFINNELAVSVDNGVAPDFDTSKSPYFETLRFCGGQPAAFFYDNVLIREFKDATVANAISAGSLSGWASGVYVGGYDMPEMPTLATVDGTPYTSAEELETLFSESREELTVDFQRLPFSPITITVDATIETHGWLQGDLIVLGEDTTATLAGSTLTVDGPFIESSDSTDVDGTNLNSAIADTDGNDISYAYSANDYSFDFKEITPYGSNNPYFLMYPAVDNSDSHNSFVTLQIDNSISITSTSYFVLDIDLATESEAINNLTLGVSQRTTGTASKFSDSAQVLISDYITPSDNWTHVTLVGDFQDNILYIFTDGVLAGTIANGANVNKDTAEASAYHPSDIRINLGTQIALDRTDTVLFDNVSIRYYASNAEAGDIEAAIADGNFTDWASYTAGRSGEALPSIATVNGKSYGNINTANEALTSTEELTVTLDKTPFAGAVTISAPAILKSNGLAYNLSAYVQVESDNGTVTVIKLLDDVHVSVTVSGVVIYDEYVRPGTDIQETLESFGSHGTSVVAGSGEIFTNVNWSIAPDVAVGDTDYVGTGTAYTNLFYVYDANGAQVSADYTVAGLENIIRSSDTRSIVLNDNIDIASQAITWGRGTKNLYLNGYTVNFPGNGNHAFSVSSSSETINFYGPGMLSDMNHTATQQFIFANWGWAGKVTLNNLSLELSSSLATIRDGGSIDINNCTVNSVSLYNSAFVNIGEMYGTAGQHTTTAATLNITDSYLSYRTFGGTGTMFNHKIVSGYKMGDTSTAPLVDPNHRINIKGSTIIAEAAVLASYQTGAWNTEKTNYDTATAGDDVVSNLVVNVQDSKLIAKTLWGGSKFLATVNIGNNTSVNSALNNHASFASATLAEGVVATKSNDHLADTTYTSYYASVTWENDTTEKWAHGSTPVASNPLVKVEKVSGGKSYTFINKLTEAPFDLSASLTLGSDITFNIYISYEDPIEALIVNGETLEASEKLIGGTTLVWAYTVKLDPAYAAADFDMIFKLSDGSTIVRQISVADYASLVYNRYSENAEVKALTSNTLNYIKASAEYFGVNANLAEINTLLSSNNAVIYDLPTSSTTNASAINSYVTSIQLNVMSTLRFRFNLASGVDGNDVVIKVGGEAKQTYVTGSYVEVELRAYEMSGTITIEVAGASGTTDLAYYCAAVLAGKGTSGTQARRYELLYTRGGMLSAIYSYAVAASAYKSTL